MSEEEDRDAGLPLRPAALLTPEPRPLPTTANAARTKEIRLAFVCGYRDALQSVLHWAALNQEHVGTSEDSFYASRPRARQASGERTVYPAPCALPCAVGSVPGAPQPHIADAGRGPRVFQRGCAGGLAVDSMLCRRPALSAFPVPIDGLISMCKAQPVMSPRR